ncbi:hypothetical protein U1Q18_001598 [Sarracenia purpurea var. burkii]
MFGLLILGGCWVLGGGGLFCAFVGVAAVVWGVGFGGLLFVGLQVGRAGVSGWGVLVWVALCFILFYSQLPCGLSWSCFWWSVLFVSSIWCRNELWMPLPKSRICDADGYYLVLGYWG